jgi:hypothetical protein
MKFSVVFVTICLTGLRVPGVLVVSVQEYLSRRGPIGAKSKFSMYIDSYLCYNIIPVIFVERTIS